MGLAQTLRKTGRARDAIAPLRRALEVEPDWVDAWEELATALDAAGNPAEAAQARRTAQAKLRDQAIKNNRPPSQ
jgi:predicted Zn-dependent protease